MDSGFDLATTEALADGKDPLPVVLVDMYQFAHCCVGFLLFCFARFGRRVGAVRYVYVYVVCMHMYAHKETGCKGTKKIPYMQIYMGNSFKNVDFATKISNYSV
jgi:hypothetical protein